ncbi:MAG: hypothetical protein JSS83_12450 [Cyanobacteria bacterium SZAS LIN-3]|nr:hypothetical protein [Cyanobacteria bacterium SZAS LIN-3]
MSQRCQLYRVMLITAAMVLTLNAPALAGDEREEEAAASKLHNFINQAYAYPAGEAFNKGELQRALTLRQRALDEWQEQHYEWSWARDLQRSQIGENMRGQAAILTAMGRYDDAAAKYLEISRNLAKIQPEWGSPAALEAAEAYMTGKMYDKARNIFENIIKAKDAQYSLPAHMGISRSYEAEGNARLAEKELTDQLASKELTQAPGAVRAIRLRLQQLYTNSGRKNEAAKIQAQLDDKHCPKCGSAENVVPIGYGLLHGPAVGFHPGGCVSSPDSPRWWCNTDGISF